jgi:hypothetical protein
VGSVAKTDKLALALSMLPHADRFHILHWVDFCRRLVLPYANNTRKAPPFANDDRCPPTNSRSYCFESRQGGHNEEHRAPNFLRMDTVSAGLVELLCRPSSAALTIGSSPRTGIVVNWPGNGAIHRDGGGGRRHWPGVQEWANIVVTRK